MAATSFQFTKMTGAGNDFIVMDNRAGEIPAEGREATFARWCRRRLGVGADGVLLVEPPENPAHDFRMRYYNADGGEVETCGNGARCIARFAFLAGAAPRSMKFETQAGPYEAEVLENDEVSLGMPDPTDLRRDLNLGIEGLADPVDFINSGVPHVVAFTDRLAAIDLKKLGAAIRYHERFAPAGTNANFAQVEPGGTIAVRTYERGVEDETLACGTGSIAVALIASLRGLAASPVSIRTTGGPLLTIHFAGHGDHFSSIRLQGEARIVYRATLEESAWGASQRGASTASPAAGTATGSSSSPAGDASSRAEVGASGEDLAEMA